MGLYCRLHSQSSRLEVKYRPGVTVALQKDLCLLAKAAEAAMVAMVETAVLVAVVVAALARKATVERLVERKVTSWSAIALARSPCCALRTDWLMFCSVN
jgi:hypothetical protein